MVLKNRRLSTAGIRWVAVVVLSVLLMFDAVHSFDQYYRTPLDGDLPGAVVPADDVKPVLSSPLGCSALCSGKHYPNPNKHFAHRICHVWFNSVPVALQRWVAPIDSAYLACALAKMLMHVALVILMAVLVSGRMAFWRLEWLGAAALMSPMLQSYGYISSMRIIDSATTYAFFYALPTIVLILYLLPFLMELLHGRRCPWWFCVVWLLWLPPTVFSGPLNPGIALVICVVVAAMLLFLRQRPSSTMLILLVPLAVGSLYSLYLGTYNSLNDAPSLSLWERYAAMPEGLWFILTGKLAWPVLVAMLVLNAVLLRRFLPGELRAMRIRWVSVGLFSGLYLLLLPLGGYREYRPCVVRYDTIIPITLCMLYMYVWTTSRLLAALSRRQMGRWYLVPVALMLFIYTNADCTRFTDNTGEREAIARIAASSESVVPLDTDCCVAEWSPQSNPECSRLAVQMFRRWNILDDDKLYFHSQ